MPSGSPARLTADEATILVVDVQEKLFPKIDNASALARNISFLLDAARVLNVPAIGTEQYPKGLGPTIPELGSRLRKPLPEKQTFSCCGIPGLVERFGAEGRRTVLVVGIETHVCVMQTALDLLAHGLRVFVAVDAVGSRCAVDHRAALRRMELAGAIPCTVEMAAFEFTRASGTPRFKEISKLVQERMKNPGQESS